MPRTRRHLQRLGVPGRLRLGAQGSGWREPSRLAPTFIRAIVLMLTLAAAGGGTVHFITLTSRTFGSQEAVLGDLKRWWSLFTQSTVWRPIVHAIWVFSDLGRPHCHLVALLPPGLGVNRVRNRWSAGRTDSVQVTSADRLGAYIAAQWQVADGKRPYPHRFWGMKPATRRCLAWRGNTNPTPADPPMHASLSPRAGAGGPGVLSLETRGARRGTRSRRCASAAEGPQAQGPAASATRGSEVEATGPPRGSEQRTHNSQPIVEQFNVVQPHSRHQGEAMKPTIDSKILAGQCLKAAKKAIVAEVVRHHLKVLKRGLEARLGGAVEAVRTIDETVQMAVQQAELIASRIEQELTVQKVDMPAPATPVPASPPLPAPAGTQLPPPAPGQAPAPFLPIALARPAGEPPPFLPRAAGGVAQLPFLPMPAPVTQPVPDGGDTTAEAPRQPWRYDPDRFAPAQASGASR